MAANSQMLRDGYSTTITIANLPLVKLYEKSVTYGATSLGGGIDVTTMRNSSFVTMAPKSLKTEEPLTLTVAYATEALDDIMAQMGVNQQITVTLPDTSYWTFWGFIDSFTPSAHTPGEQPTADISIVKSNMNTDWVETGPVYYPPTES